jgi:serine/threonine-protein kinase
MTPERWREVERIYQDALDQDPESRTVFVDRACAGDSDLRREVLSLLEAHRPGDRFLESSALDVAARALAGDALPLERGRRLGPYELVARLGVGGMGEVWRATDPALHRDVAVR